MTKLLNDDQLNDIRGDLSKVTNSYEAHKAAFIDLLGMPKISENAVKAAWSVYVAHHLKNYGSGPATLDIDTLLAAETKTIMCSQYSTVALHLFKEFGLPDTMMTVIGWDESAIGDHSQILFNDGDTKLLLDPTVGLVARDVTLESIFLGKAPTDYASFLKDDALDWYSDKIIDALDNHKMKLWNLTYSVPGFNEWETNRAEHRVVVGTSANDHIDAGDGNDVIFGLDGSDTLIGGDGNDVIYAAGNSDILIGGKGNDIMVGGSGNDKLMGENGIDIMVGASGNDKYYVDDYRELVIEFIGPQNHNDAGGTDKIFSLVSYRLPDFVEHMTLTGNRSANAIGNNLNNYLFGNSGNNKIDGRQGADRLYGDLGADNLYGGKDHSKDIFEFDRPSESTLSTKDIIHDFELNIDKIDLRGIDADIKTANNQAFKFSGTEAHKNSVWFKDVGADVYVHADVNGDLNPDFSVQLLGMSKVSSADVYL